MSRVLWLLAVAILLVVAPMGRAFACEGSEVIFEDKFADDAGGWAIKETVEVKDGSFIFKLPADDMQSNLNVTFTIDKDADLCSETVWPEGEQPVLGAGLLFWGVDNRTYFQFGVLNNGKFWIARKIDGKWHTIAENIASSAINTSAGATNTLRVKVSGNTVAFYINGTKVRDLRGQPPKGIWRFGISGDNFGKDKEAQVVFKSVKVTN